LDTVTASATSENPEVRGKLKSYAVNNSATRLWLEIEGGRARTCNQLKIKNGAYLPENQG
jgi:hypothetical protein